MRLLLFAKDGVQVPPSAALYNTRMAFSTDKLVYGFLPQLHDPRDRLLKLAAPTHLPAAVDLSPSIPFIFDQGGLGSCTSNAACLALARLQRIQNPRYPFVPSRLFHYFNERQALGSTAWDSGATLRSALKTLAKDGVPKELLWPYVESKLTDAPPFPVYKSALQHRVFSYAAVDISERALKTALAASYVICIGITAYDFLESAEAAKTGYVAMPGPDESPLGGHAILLVGYDDSTRRFKFANSWSSDWGQGGFGYLDYEYVLTLGQDAWVLESLTSTATGVEGAPIC